MPMDYAQAAKKLATMLELEQKGYAWHLDRGHKHPRLYIMSQGEERFTPLSSTENYDNGNILQMKRQDIERDILPKLPKPKVPEKSKSANGKICTKNVEVVSSKVFSVKLFIAARGTLAFQLPEGAIPKDKQLAQPQLFKEKFGIIFSPDHGTKPSNTKTEGLKCYWFARHKVPFKYASGHPDGWKSENVCARMHGDSLVCDSPIPIEILEDEIKLVPKGTAAAASQDKEFSLATGTRLKNEINKWIKWVRNRGEEPTLSIDKKGLLSITVTTKIVREL